MSDHGLIKTEPQKTVIIFGVSSFVGSNLAEFLKRHYKVVGTYYHSPVRIPGVLTVRCDVLAKEEVQLVLYAFKPDLVIYCAGLSSIRECAENEEVADALNTAGLINVAEYCQRYKARVCYISSSFVFGGEKRDYIEMDIPDSNTVYGKTMASSEFYLQKTSLNYIIFRCCKLYGRTINPARRNWFEVLQLKMREGRNFSCDNVVHTGFLDVLYLGSLIKICLEKSVTNRLFQVSSNDCMSVYDFAKLYANIFRESAGLASKGTWPFPRTAATAGHAPDDIFQYKMDITNIEGYLNVQLPSIEESLKFTYQRYFGRSLKDSKGDGVEFI